MHVEKIDTEEKFQALKQDWNRLLSQSAADTIFLSWDWLFTWWRIYGQGRELYILTVKDQDQLIGIVPLYKEHKRVLRIFSKAYLSFIGSEHVGSDYLDFIIHPQKYESAIAAILDFLQKHHRDWDVIRLAEIPDTSLTIKLVQERWRNRHRMLLRVSQICPYIELPESWEKLLKTIGARTRSNIRRARRKFDKNDFRIERVDQDHTLSQALDGLIKLSEERNNSASPFSDTKFCEFHHELIARLGSEKRAKLYFIHQNSALVAGNYLYSHGNRRYGYITEINEAFAKISPGVGLLGHCIEEAISEGIGEFDLLRGREKWKTHWTKKYRKTLNLEIYHDRFTSLLLYLIYKYHLESRRWIKRRVKLLIMPLFTK